MAKWCHRVLKNVMFLLFSLVFFSFLIPFSVCVYHSKWKREMQQSPWKIHPSHGFCTVKNEVSNHCLQTDIIYNG